MQTATLRLVARATRGIVVVLLSMSAAWSADPAPTASPSQAEPSKEMREKMATLHEQMAACLRSDKSVAECRTEMMKSCRETVGAQGCPMMGRGHMMQTPPANATSGK